MNGEVTSSTLDLFKLNGKVAAVTRARKGIGRGCAIALAAAGADVVLSARDGVVLAEVAREKGD